MPSSRVPIFEPQLHVGDEQKPIILELLDGGHYSLGPHRDIRYPLKISLSLPDPDAEFPWKPVDVTLNADGTYIVEAINRSEMTREHHYNELGARYERVAKDGWSIQTSSYQVRNSDHTPRGWIAQVHVMHDTYDATTMQPLMQKDPQIYDTQGEANYWAMRIGIAWLEKKLGLA
jgi:hypothetical protein